jgi:DNA polymerase I-like protein with 3'-5' exonuclease and polymerase domains
MNTDTKFAYELLHDGILALAEAEKNGLRIDVDYIKKQKKEISEKIKLLEQEIYDSKFYKDWSKTTTKTVNIYSGQQLGNYLYKTKGLKIRKETKGGEGSTDEEVLRLLNIPELNILLEIKKLKKVRDTYLAQYERELVDRVIHPFFNLHNVISYRSSSSAPNIQNVIKHDKEMMQMVRKAIYPRKGHQLLELDYSQLEVRISACYSGDKKLIEDILHGDMHRDTAIELFKIKNFDKSKPSHSVLRGTAKNGFVFPQFYGDYYKNCAINLVENWGKLPKGTWKAGQGIDFENRKLSDHLIEQGLTSFKKFEKHVQEVEYNFWKKRYKTHDRWRENLWKEYQENGYIYSKIGYTFQGIMAKNKAVNYPIQCDSFTGCLLWSLIEGTKALKRMKMDSVIVAQIHDAILFSVNPKELKRLVKIMQCIMCNDVRQHWKWITVPLEISAELCPVDGSWAEKEEIEINKL